MQHGNASIGAMRRCFIGRKQRQQMRRAVAAMGRMEAQRCVKGCVERHKPVGFQCRAHLASASPFIQQCLHQLPTNALPLPVWIDVQLSNVQPALDFASACKADGPPRFIKGRK